MTSTTLPTRGRDDAFFRLLLGTGLRHGAWVWLIVLVATLGIPFLVAHFGGTPLGVFSTSAQGPRWYLFVSFLVVLLASLRPSVAFGMTRRSFGRQSLRAGLAAALVHGLDAALVQLVESLLFRAQGWAHTSVYGLRPVPEGPWPLVALDHAVVLAVFAVSGVAVAAVYLRWGGWLGTLILPPVAAPVFVVPGLLDHIEPVELGNALDQLAYPAGLALSIASVVALAVLADLALRGTRIGRSPID